jgi:hypothetical protein
MTRKYRGFPRFDWCIKVSQGTGKPFIGIEIGKLQ